MYQFAKEGDIYEAVNPCQVYLNEYAEMGPHLKRVIECGEILVVCSTGRIGEKKCMTIDGMHVWTPSLDNAVFFKRVT